MKFEMIMNHKRISFFITLLLLSFFGTSFAQTKLAPTQFDSMLGADKSVQLIDVRTPAEVATGYIKGAKNIDFSSSDFAKNLNSLDKSKPVAVYCAIGGRSGKAALKLKELGFTKIYDLAGGMTEWKAQRKSVVTTAVK